MKHIIEYGWQTYGSKKGDLIIPDSEVWYEDKWVKLMPYVLTTTGEHIYRLPINVDPNKEGWRKLGEDECPIFGDQFTLETHYLDWVIMYWGGDVSIRNWNERNSSKISAVRRKIPQVSEEDAAFEKARIEIINLSNLSNRSFFNKGVEFGKKYGKT